MGAFRGLVGSGVSALAALLGVLQLPFLVPGWLAVSLALLAWPWLRVGGRIVLLLVVAALLRADQRVVATLPASCERLPVTLSGEIVSLIDVQRYGQRDTARFLFAVHDLQPARCAGPRRVRLYWSEPPTLEPGERLTLETRLRVPWGLRNPRQSSAQTRHFTAGLHALGSVRARGRRDAASGPSPAGRLHRYREAAVARVHAVAGGAGGALLAALLIGDTRGLEAADWQRLRLYGLTHLFVISGMHVSLAAGTGWLLGSFLSRLAGLTGAVVLRRYCAPLAALGVAVPYALVAGMGLPAQRALAMLAPVLLLAPLGRRSGPWHLLSLALLFLLAIDPFAVLGPSLWLSCSAVALLLWAAAWQGRSGVLRRSALLQAYMSTAMLPLGLYWFGAASSLGAAVNLVAIPAVSLLVLPLGLLGLLLGALGLPDQLPLRVCAQALELLWFGLVHWEPLLAARAYHELSPGVPALGLALLAVLLLPLPGGPLRLLLVALLSLPLLWRVPPGNDNPEVLVFDMGQGTAVLVSHAGRSLLYDTGGGIPGAASLAERVVLPYLRQRGIRRLDLLVISHLDQDHSAGLDAIRRAFPVALTWSGVALPGAEKCRPGRRLRLAPGLEVVALSTHRPGDSDNNGSCVLRVDVGTLRVLLPGDIDVQRERELVAFWGDELRADVLLAAHHGSGSSSSRLWLRTVRAREVIATAGRANRFGHPAPGVVARVEQQGARLWNTARHGAILIRPDDDAGLRVVPTRHALRPFWWGR
jgi:competence protein ComEC